jgi:hypothetical protein
LINLKTASARSRHTTGAARRRRSGRVVIGSLSAIGKSGLRMHCKCLLSRVKRAWVLHCTCLLLTQSGHLGGGAFYATES